MDQRTDDLLTHASLIDKTRLLAGVDAWHTVALPQYELPSLTLSDGPYGLRKVIDGSLTLNDSLPATAFPTSSLVASSWDVKLLKEMGQLLGKEARNQQVDVLLGPGLNIKRSPLCGRNFEYFSEDPLLSGKLAAAMVKGIQSEGVAATIKHFVANSQETKRLLNNAIIDERTLREIYLRGFEIAVHEGKPLCLMTSYNMVNGDYMSENKELVDDILRQEWGFRGVVMTDWGAMHNPVNALRAGVDLEMPGGILPRHEVNQAISNYELDPQHLNQSVSRICELAYNLHNRPLKAKSVNYDDHFEKARKIAADSMVLLKNENILPLDKKQKVTVIGAFATDARFQGAGSSQIHPYKLDNLLQALNEEKITYDYARGFTISTSENNDDQLRSEALKLAVDSQMIIVMAGLPPIYEAEGSDREFLRLPDNQDKLIRELGELGIPIVVVISAGAPVIMPWINHVSAILMAYLGGEASGHAISDIIFGQVNPSGRLAETFPLIRDDTPSIQYYAGANRNVEYRESVFVGYRYYDSANRPVLFPFGFGLGYSSFSYDNLKLSQVKIHDKDKLTVSFDLTNTGNLKGKEVVQVYIAPPNGPLFRPQHGLVAFDKIELAAGETQNVTFILSANDLSVWNVLMHDWCAPSGKYQIQIAHDSRDIRLNGEFEYVNAQPYELPDYHQNAPVYYSLANDGHFETHFREFEAIYGHKIYHVYSSSHRPFSYDNCLNDAINYPTGRLLVKQIKKMALKMAGDDPILSRIYVESVLDTPIGSLPALSGGQVDYEAMLGMLDMINGRFIRGLFRLGKALHKNGDEKKEK